MRWSYMLSSRLETGGSAKTKLNLEIKYDSDFFVFLTLLKFDIFWRKIEEIFMVFNPCVAIRY